MAVTQTPPKAPAPQAERQPSVLAHAAWATFPVALVEWLAVAVLGPRWPLDTGVAVGLAWVVFLGAARAHHKDGGPVMWAAFWGALAGLGWAVFALVTSAWSRVSWELLGAAMTTFWVWYALAKVRHDAWLAGVRERERARNEKLDREKWPRILADCGFPGITVAKDPAEPREGLVVVTLKLPPNGRVTFKVLDAARENIEAAAGLRHGAISFHQRWENSALVDLQVSYVDRLRDTYPFPGDTSNLSILRPFPIGVGEDGKEMCMRLREVATFVVGLRGAGKSNFINVLVAQLARMPDVVVFMYDGKGGRTGVPWVRPWLDGKCDRPVIDWLATNRDEAERMINACVRAQESRSRKGAGHGAKVTPSPRMPAIVLIVEECALIFSGTYTPTTAEVLAGATTNTRLANRATQLVELGRSEAVDPVLVTRRSTVDNFGNSMLKNQIEQRVGLGVTRPEDAANAMGTSVAGKTLARMRWKGAGVLKTSDEGPVAPYKGWLFEDPRLIYAHAEACGDRRPAPDPDTADALGRDYATRWSRFPDDILLSLGVKLTTKRTQQLADRRVDEDQEFARIVAQDFGETARVNPAKPVLLEFLHTRGVRGAVPNEMFKHLKARGVKVDDSTVYGFLREWIAAGVVAKPDPKLPRYLLAQFHKKEGP